MYRGFYDLLAAALTTVRAREDERRRAEALAAVDRAKAAFFSNVSHEFRTPLTFMPGPVEGSLASAEQLPGDERERVSLAYRNGRLLKLVNSLLDFSRIEESRVQACYGVNRPRRPHGRACLELPLGLRAGRPRPAHRGAAAA